MSKKEDKLIYNHIERKMFRLALILGVLLLVANYFLGYIFNPFIIHPKNTGTSLGIYVTNKISGKTEFCRPRLKGKEDIGCIPLNSPKWLW